MQVENVIESENENTTLSQLCGFKIGDGYYGIPVLDVREVIKPLAVTDVPLSPEYVKGLVNLRGQIVTLVDLRKLFGLEEKENTEEYMNIIVRSGDSLYSLVVDEILDVIDVEQRVFESTPETLNEQVREYISGVYKLDEKLLILLNLEKILNIKK